MTNLFLKAKHWQLFLFLFGIPAALEIYSQYRTFADMESVTEPALDGVGFEGVLKEQFIQGIPAIFIIKIVFVFLFFLWLWSISTGLQNRVPKDISLKVKKFKIFCYIPFTYFVFIMMFISGGLPGLRINPIEYGGIIIAIIIPLHFFSMFCILYCFYFTAKTIKTAELERKVVFGDFIGEFLLLWFYPIGIWFLQPRLNKLIEKPTE